MTVEGLWYASFDASGTQPRPRRFSRLPMGEQWNASIAVAIAFAMGRAGYRQVGCIPLTGERWWYWRSDLAPLPQGTSGDWWLMPARILRRVELLIDRAGRQARRELRRTPSYAEIACVLRRWRRTGCWRRHAMLVSPRSATRPRAPQRRRTRRKLPA